MEGDGAQRKGDVEELQHEEERPTRVDSNATA